MVLKSLLLEYLDVLRLRQHVKYLPSVHENKGREYASFGIRDNSLLTLKAGTSIDSSVVLDFFKEFIEHRGIRNEILDG